MNLKKSFSRTNLPYQMMEFPDFHHPDGTTTFLNQTDILRFLHSYADHFNLKKHIKLNHFVVRVLPVENGKWEILVKDLPNNEFITRTFDAVIVCNGHFAAPRIPVMEGVSEFKGRILHSHDFRRAEAFTGMKKFSYFKFNKFIMKNYILKKIVDQNVLVIGNGPSGVDLVIHISKVAKHVTLSRNKPKKETPEERKRRENALPPKTVLQDNVKRFTADGVEFIDGTTQTFSTIIFATGAKLLHLQFHFIRSISEIKIYINILYHFDRLQLFVSIFEC